MEGFTMEFYEKIERIGIPDKNIGILELPFEVIEVDDTVLNKRIDKIRARDIVGTTRPVDGIAVWADALNNLFHKEHLLKPEKMSKINEILLMPNDGAYPCVVQKGEKYYIDDNGLHRLIIAKFLNIEEITVIVKKYD